MRALNPAKAFACAFLLFSPMVHAQDDTVGPPNLAALRRLRALEAGVEPPNIGTGVAPGQEIWTLSPGATTASKGTFGIDLSHYETDDCTLNWQTVKAT